MRDSEDIFCAGGPIHENLTGYEVRGSQVEMTAAVEETVASGGVLLAEAGTGTGKTLAYLVPLILSPHVAVVSTGTKTLQEQIFFKDIEFLSKVFGEPIDAALLKGQNNYLCMRRMKEFERSPKVLTYPSEQVVKLRDWAAGTLTGDRMELLDLKDDDPIWFEVSSSKDTRIGAKCPFFEECFFTRARREAMNAKLVIVNHHLYFADLATRQAGGGILPAHDVVVFDEAHMIEDIATEFFSLSVSSSKVERVCRDALVAVAAARLSEDPSEKTREKNADAVRSASKRFFGQWRRGAEGRARLVPEEIDRDNIEEYYRVDSALEAVEHSLKVIEGKEPAIDHASKRVTALRDEFADVVLESMKGFVHWVENRRRSIVLGASPIDVSEILREGIFFRIPAVILSSATLSAGGDFSYLKSRFGLDFDATELSLSSPFDYQTQARVYLPAEMPDPRRPEFTDAVAREASSLIHVTRGGALVLFTSIQNMRSVFELLREESDGPVMIQGEAPRTSLIEKLMANRDAVLCATASFWQGVDIPGDALRLVIIDKLPFASPTDPLVAARIEDIREKGGNPFKTYQVPQAALALKQGAGRLIRTAADRGILAVLDKRLHTAGYASSFLKSLPASPRTGVLAEIEAWWGRAE